MIARAVVLVSLIAAAGCGNKARPAPTTPAGGAGATGGAAASTVVALDGVPWTLAVAGTVSADEDYGQKVTAPGFELGVMGWPRSEAFVQTAAEHLDGMRESAPGLQVLHQVDGGEYAFEVVVDTGSVVDGTVLVPEPDGGDGAMCGFKLERGADWHPALAACRSLTRAGDR
jgi:hypothetical protein